MEKDTLNIVREMSTDVIRILVNNLFKESFYGKKKKINVLTTLFIFHKNDVKIFLKLIINYCLALINIINIIKSPKKTKKRRQSNGFRPRKALDAFQQKQGLFFVV